MDRKFNAVYDETAEECMYPLPGESDAQFKERLAILRKKRRTKMTPEEIRRAKLLAKGELSEEELKRLIIEE